jgi:dihydroorotase
MKPKPELATRSISGIEYLDISTGKFKQTRISVRDGILVESTSEELFETLPGRHILTPGLTDLHTHLFVGQDLGIPKDRDLRNDGIFRAADAGSAGGHLFQAFRDLVIEQSDIEIRAFLNISSLGTTSVLLQGELMTPAYVNVDLAVNTIREHSDVTIGIKVRASEDAGGDFALDALVKARRAADIAGVPLMVHLGPAPASVEDVIQNLGSGDILTHCFTGWQGNAVTENGKPKSFVVDAIRRGVLFDVGHGRGGFDSTVAAAMIEAGYLPDSISTDIHSVSMPKVISLPNVMSKFLALGMTLEDVISRTTNSPKDIGGFKTGNGVDYQVGELANFAIFEVEEGDFQFEDVHGHSFTGNYRVKPALVVRHGEIVSS